MTNIKTTGATCEAGSMSPVEAPKMTPGVLGCSCCLNINDIYQLRLVLLINPEGLLKLLHYVILSDTKAGVILETQSINLSITALGYYHNSLL